MANKKQQPQTQSDDLSDIGKSASFEMKPFLAVMLITVAMCILLWNSFRAERAQTQNPATPQVQQIQSAEPQRPIRRSVERSMRR